ncbi:MAG: glutamine--tRNA ligase/YqeY domain fusion protein [Flavobacteriales bacterium]
MENKATNFIHAIIEEDLRLNKNNGKVHTRFPPEPNGYLHIGHAKSMCLNFGTAEKYNGKCNLRFDDTNPETEEIEYVESIKEDIRWLGFDWEDRIFHASDYFDQLYEFALKLIENGDAYVCELSAEEFKEYRGTPEVPGRESPWRNRPVEENLKLFRDMKAGKFEEGSYTLRAKVDMSSPNMHMRDPAIYRIRKRKHYRTGEKWCIYPMYDFAHCLSDAIEGITHSLCTLEFEVHRPIYDWFVDKVIEGFKPRQIEFARLNLSYTVMSKRILAQLVKDKHVSGWNDPRMPTLSALRRRGYTPASIKNFCNKIGVAKRDGMIDIALLEHTLREDLNKNAPRAMAVLNPLKVIITNYPTGQEEEIEAVNNPEDASMGTRKLPFSAELYIERDDFMESPPRKFYRLTVGREVRLRYAYFITCNEVVKDNDTGEIKELLCTYDPATRGGNATDGRKVKSTLHWVSAPHAFTAEVRLYDRLFNVPDPASQNDGFSIADHLNPDSITILKNCKLEPGLKNAKPESIWQFERIGYFCVDNKDSKDGCPVFNRAVSLRDTWAKISDKFNKE